MKKVNKWFLVALAAVLVLMAPLYGDWNLFTSVRGYAFRPTETTQEIIDSADKSAWWTPEFELDSRRPRSFVVTNDLYQSPFEGQIITFLGRDTIHFNDQVYFLSLRGPYRVSLSFWDYEAINFGPWLRRYDFRGLARWHEETGDSLVYVLSAATLNNGVVRNIGPVRNFLSLAAPPILVLVVARVIWRGILRRREE